MPICSTCHESKEFSSAQLKKKSAERKCVECVHEINETTNEFEPSFEDKRAKLCKWLTTYNAEINISLTKNSENNRCLVANKRMIRGQSAVFIPEKCMMTMTDAKSCELVKKINYNSQSSHTLLALYLLQEKKKQEKSFFYPYITLLPNNYNDIPIHWSKEKTKELNGTICEHMIKMKKHLLLVEYKTLDTNLIHFEEFQWARTVVITRVFNCKIKSIHVECLVPIADMMNHALEPNVEWSFNNDLDGFQMLMTKCIVTNSQLHDSYGLKCNSRWLTNYSFTIPNNDLHNQTSLFFPNPKYFDKIICQRNFDDNFSGYNYCIQNKLESKVSQDLNFRFQVSAILDGISESNLTLIRNMFGFARCCCLDYIVQDNNILFSNKTILQTKDDYVYDINPMLKTEFVSEENEIAAIELIQNVAQQTLSRIVSKSDDFHISTMITGEKQVLLFYCNLYEFTRCNKFSKLRKSEKFQYYWNKIK